ncbi:MAG TPA: DUF1269 domain-containing protein [Gammaproteobacteria bacterium]|jgi:hypothetical protein|nr:DUF1269 domain-containing protein [Gammaproteobacteria bacterium]
MRRRVYFVLPDAETAHQVERELLLARIDDGHMHFMAKDESGMTNLPLANLAQRTDIIPGMEHGLLYGGLTGVAMGSLMYFMPSLTATFGMGIILVLAIVGALVGVWVSGMIGIGIPSSRLKRFEKTLEQGHVLLMADLPKDRVEEISDMIRRHHHNAEQFGEEPTIPAFP